MTFHQSKLNTLQKWLLIHVKEEGEPPCGPLEGCVETLQRGVGVEVCPAEPPLDLESVCERFGGVSRSCRPRRRRRGNPLVVR